MSSCVCVCVSKRSWQQKQTFNPFLQVVAGGVFYAPPCTVCADEFTVFQKQSARRNANP